LLTNDLINKPETYIEALNSSESKERGILWQSSLSFKQ